MLVIHNALYIAVSLHIPLHVWFVFVHPLPSLHQLNRTVLLPVALLPCPPGYTLRSEDTDRLECLCVTDRNILQCLDESGKVVLQVRFSNPAYTTCVRTDIHSLTPFDNSVDILDDAAEKLQITNVAIRGFREVSYDVYRMWKCSASHTAITHVIGSSVWRVRLHHSTT